MSKQNDRKSQAVTTEQWLPRRQHRAMTKPRRAIPESCLIVTHQPISREAILPSDNSNA